ncbi:hypothetical protein SH1V18_48280 [Vallitalea longa]|uniref:Uncharacterized protein n=1 Tax=Vallitalea longa TaxID=2936439 RepID=A0A9W5YHF9_9FIRM|nr:hypothetical protein SH1V18_48280 [Vallitalea longa]
MSKEKEKEFTYKDTQERLNNIRLDQVEKYITEKGDRQDE